MDSVTPNLGGAPSPLNPAERARADFEPARRAMLAAWRACARELPPEELRDEIAATANAMRGIADAGGWAR